MFVLRLDLVGILSARIQKHQHFKKINTEICIETIFLDQDEILAGTSVLKTNGNDGQRYCSITGDHS